MKTYRELLELAAKAAGIVGLWHERGQCIHVTDCAGMSDMWWRPLEDDGDALRLAVKLGLLVHGDASPTNVYCQVGECPGGYIEKSLPCPYAATRRAIVRAAAEIALRT